MRSRWIPLLLLTSCSTRGGTPDAGSREAAIVDAGPTEAVRPSAPAEDRIPRLYAGVFLHDLSNLDMPNGRFDADFELWAKWRGALDPNLLRIANTEEVEITALEHSDDGDWHAARWHVHGTLRGRFPVDRFPFDEQHAAIVLEMPEDAGHLVPDLASSGMAREFGVSDWIHRPEFHLASHSEVFASDLGMLSHEGQPTRVHRVSFDVTLDRPLAPVALKLFLPLSIILLVAFMQLFLRPDLIDARSAIGVTSLLTTFAFQFTVEGTLPRVSYITTADALFLLAYVASTLALLTTIIGYGLHRAQKERAARALDRGAQIALPLVVLLSVGWVLPKKIPPISRPETAMPEMARHPSARDTLRIGTTVLSTIVGSVVYSAADWSLVEDSRGGVELPVYVSPRPAIDNDALRFIPNGAFEITWRVRPNMHWSDGHALTSTDLALGFAAFPDDNVESTEALDTRTFRVRYHHRIADALTAPSPWPAHIYQAEFDRAGPDPILQRRRVEPAPTLGPYRITSFTPRESLVAEANPHFPGARASIPNVVVRGFTDREALVQAFANGELDMTDPNSITLEQALAIQRVHPEWVHLRASATLILLEPDLNHPLLGRREVRQALLRAIDRGGIVNTVYQPGGRVAVAPVPVELTGIQLHEFRPDEARRVLETAGLAGQTLPLFTDPSPVSLRIVERIVIDLARVGVRVEVHEVPNTLPLHRDGAFQGGLLLHAIRATVDGDPRRFWNLRTVHGEYDDNVRNDAFDTAVTELMIREERALYPERRQQLRERLLSMVTERLPILPLVFASERVLAHPSLQNWESPPDVRFGTGMEEWYFAQTGGQGEPQRSESTGLPSDGQDGSGLRSTRDQ